MHGDGCLGVGAVRQDSTRWTWTSLPATAGCYARSSSPGGLGPVRVWEQVWDFLVNLSGNIQRLEGLESTTEFGKWWGSLDPRSWGGSQWGGAGEGAGVLCSWESAGDLGHTGFSWGHAGHCPRPEAISGLFHTGYSRLDLCLTESRENNALEEVLHHSAGHNAWNVFEQTSVRDLSPMQ